MTWVSQSNQSEAWFSWLLQDGQWSDSGQWDDSLPWLDGLTWNGQASQSEAWAGQAAQSETWTPQAAGPWS